MFNLIGKIIITFSVFSLLFNLPAAIAYQPSVHRKITEHAVLKSQRIQSALEAAGILPHDGALKDFGIRDWSYSDWIQHGAGWEDGISGWNSGMYTKRGIMYCHFYNPITGFGYTDSDGDIIGQSLIERANDTEEIYGYLQNEWSYAMAKRLYYTALTGDPSDIISNVIVMRDGHSQFSGTVPANTNLNNSSVHSLAASCCQRQ